MSKLNAVAKIKEDLAMDTMLLVVRNHKNACEAARRERAAREQQEAYDLQVAHARMGVFLAGRGICQPVYREVW